MKYFAPKMTNSTAGIFRKIIKYQNLSNMHMADMLIDPQNKMSYLENCRSSFP